MTDPKKPVPTDPFAGLDQVKPRPRATAPARSEDPALDRMRESRGFVSERPAASRKRYRAPPGREAMETTVATIRFRLQTWNAFVDWCDLHKISYREGFDRLIELIPEDERGGGFG